MLSGFVCRISHMSWRTRIHIQKRRLKGWGISRFASSYFYLKKFICLIIFAFAVCSMPNYLHGAVALGAIWTYLLCSLDILWLLIYLSLVTGWISLFLLYDRIWLKLAIHKLDLIQFLMCSPKGCLILCFCLMVSAQVCFCISIMNIKYQITSNLNTHI